MVPACHPSGVGCFGTHAAAGNLVPRLPSARSPVPSVIRQEACVKVLVYPHTMEIGGCQLNAVETAGALRDRGHDVSVISRPGPLVELVWQLGLTHIPLDPRSYRRPSPRAAAQLTRLAQEQKFDIVHGY